MKYKIGDKVLIANHDEIGRVTVVSKNKLNNTIATIKDYGWAKGQYVIEEDDTFYCYDDEFVGKIVGNKIIKGE